MKKMIMFFANLMKFYIKYFPIRLGKGILKQIIVTLLSNNFQTLSVLSADKRKFLLELPEDNARLTIFSTGFCEKNLTLLFHKIIKKDDIIFDVGANIGWFTTLFAQKGKVCYAFEPNPIVYEKMVNNCRLNNVLDKCVFSNIALGNKNGTTNFYNFKELSHGCSSLSSFNRSDKETITITIKTMTQFVKEKQLTNIDLIKVDVEGSEFDVLNGALDLLKHGFTPMWTFELNNDTSKAFNYHPSKILTTLKKYNYEFYLTRKELKKLNDFNNYKNGDEVLCVIPEIHKNRLRNVYRFA